MNARPAPPPLIILDVQDAIEQPVWNGKNNPGYLAVIMRLLAHWRKNDLVLGGMVLGPVPVLCRSSDHLL
jgi:hypothetical protein